jgi:hypothetical protein
MGDLSGAYLRRINIQHRLVYQIIGDEKTVKVIRMRLCLLDSRIFFLHQQPKVSITNIV